MLESGMILLARAAVLAVGLLVLASASAAHAEAARAVVAPTESRSLLTADATWVPVVSDGASVRVTREAVAGVEALRIDFDFSRGAGFGGATLALPMVLPGNFEFGMRVRGTGPANNLEFKLIDDTDLNVWWINRRAMEWPAEATVLANKKRHFSFAWGPSHGAALTKLGRVELIIAAAEGGRGTVWIEELTFRSLPEPKPYTGEPKATASATASGSAQSLLAADGGAWTASGERPAVTIDFGMARELGGLVTGWPEGDAGNVAGFTVERSDDGQAWTMLRRANGVSGFESWVALPDTDARYLRLTFEAQDAGRAVGVRKIEVLGLSDGASPNALWEARAKRAPRGEYPRTTLREQSYWTVLGVARDSQEGLISEEGVIEIGKRQASIEPVLSVGGKVLTWADGTHTQSLAEGWAPITTVERKHEGMSLSVTALAAGKPGESAVHAIYTVTNTSGERQKGRLVLLARPWQVLPPWQDLNVAGGWAPVRSVKAIDGGLAIDGERRIVSPNYVEFAALTFDQGDPMAWLRAGRWPETTEAECGQRAASGMLGFDFELKPGEAASYLIVVPLHGSALPTAKLERPINREQFEALAKFVLAQWNDLTGRVRLTGPAGARAFIDTVRATQAYILINHDGQGFQPGSRTYERSWIRDGSMTSAAMLELGHPGLVKDFIDWYAPYQFESGKVPCVVDRRGADPVPEHDSHGQLVWLIATYYRYTGDRAIVERHFDRVKKAVEYMASLRRERMTDEFGASGPARQEPGKPPVPALAFRGLMPESISHEGYSAKPMHSFWDTLFGLRGLNDAAFLAGIMGEAGLQAEWKKEADALRDSIRASIELVHKAHGIDYLPGCVELGDFDSTSSTIIAWPVEEIDGFPRAWTDATFERYWREFTTRRERNAWDGYTPYELRHVNAYVRLGQKERAIEVLDWLFTHQRPAGWRHWAEVVWREPNTPKMIGDMPHTWCGSDFLNAARAMLLYEDHAKKSLVVFAGLPEAWATDAAGFSFEGMASEHGTLTASSRGLADGRIEIKLSGKATPPGGFEVVSPRAQAIKGAKVNGEAVAVSAGNRVLVESLPAVVELVY
jgi:hypothetical protein